MVDLLGFGTVAQGVTTRPTDARTLGGDDTWAKPCSSPSAGDGTKVDPDWANILLAQLRRAIRGMGVTENNADDDMLLKAIQAAVNGCITIAQGRLLPIYPHISGSFLTPTAGGGQVVVPAGGVFLHRGVFTISTDSYLTAARTFNTAANKTYHLRWRWNNAAPAFSLNDLASGTYNPGVLQETDTSFDSDFDDMLIAKIVTNGSNVATITPLANKTSLAFSAVLSGSVYGIGSEAHAADYAGNLNWARTPTAKIVGGDIYMGGSGTSGSDWVQGGANRIYGDVITRNSYAFTVMTDWSQSAVGLNSFTSTGRIAITA